MHFVEKTGAITVEKMRARTASCTLLKRWGQSVLELLKIPGQWSEKIDATTVKRMCTRIVIKICTYYLEDEGNYW